MPGGSAGAVGAHEGIVQRAKWFVWEAEWFERTETEDWEVVGTIRNVGCGGCYALIF